MSLSQDEIVLVFVGLCQLMSILEKCFSVIEIHQLHISSQASTCAYARRVTWLICHRIIEAYYGHPKCSHWGFAKESAHCMREILLFRGMTGMTKDHGEESCCDAWMAKRTH
jgi:hypothetical protein